MLEATFGNIVTHLKICINRNSQGSQETTSVSKAQTLRNETQQQNRYLVTRMINFFLKISPQDHFWVAQNCASWHHIALKRSNDAIAVVIFTWLERTEIVRTGKSKQTAIKVQQKQPVWRRNTTDQRGRVEHVDAFLEQGFPTWATCNPRSTFDYLKGYNYCTAATN